ncbi:hypothetical protein EBU95_19755, partial [bacterium]|nr:hypothetical protein [bacterium]
KSTDKAAKSQPLDASKVEHEKADQESDQPEYQLMEYIEKEEKKAGRKLIKTMIKQGMPENYGQKNW